MADLAPPNSPDQLKATAILGHGQSHGADTELTQSTKRLTPNPGALAAVKQSYRQGRLGGGRRARPVTTAAVDLGEARILSKRRADANAVAHVGEARVQSKRRYDSYGNFRDESMLQVELSFEGLNAYDQRFANNGNQFNVDPPDQGLCVGKPSVALQH